MTEHMSAAEYRRQFIDKGAMPDNEFDSTLKEIDQRNQKVVKLKKYAGLVNESYELGKGAYPLTKETTDGHTTTFSRKKKSAPSMPQPTEHEIQSSILERLGLLSGAFFWRENSGLMQVGEPNKKRFFRAGTPGIPDIMGVYKGRPVGIEVKRPGKKQSIDQRAFQQRFDQVGGIYIVCTDSTQIVAQIEAALNISR
jgi:hypothetical protein